MALLLVDRSGSAVDASRIKVHKGGLELRIIEDALEYSLVVVHAAHDCAEKHAVEDQTEVVERVVAGLRGDFRVGHPRLLELIEEQLVSLIQVEAEALVELLDYLR